MKIGLKCCLTEQIDISLLKIKCLQQEKGDSDMCYQIVAYKYYNPQNIFKRQCKWYYIMTLTCVRVVLYFWRAVYKGN